MTEVADSPAEDEAHQSQLTHRKQLGDAHDSLEYDLSGGLLKFKENIPISAQKAVDEIGDFVQAVWSVVGHHHLPEWLKDNDYLLFGHRPPLPSYRACFKSIFRIHTETGNIWTHLLGCLCFILLAVYFLLNPLIEMELYDHIVYIIFFGGAITCLSFSWLFHTCCCHSPRVQLVFSKLDYCGISTLVMASFMPWLYYGFYCNLTVRLFYMSLCLILGSACIAVSLLDRFSDSSYRPVRAGLFIAFGLSGVFPAAHYIWTYGFYSAIYEGSLGWLVLMAILYITGAVVYALRFPERLCPGKFDYWGQSHQIFHICVVAAALVHCYGVAQVAQNNARPNACLD